MQMSDEGRRQLTAREGVKLKAYQDTVGVWTIGIGHTSAAGPPMVNPGLTITAQEADEIFRRDLRQYEDAVNRAVKVPLTQNQFDACVSLCFNIGTGGFARSTVVKRLNEGDKAGAADAFLFWNKPPEIMGRRRSEVAQFRTPYKALPNPPIASTPPKPPAQQPEKPAQDAKQDAAAAGVLATLGATVAAAWTWLQEWLPEILLGLVALLALAVVIFRLVKGRWPWQSNSTGGQSPVLSLPSLPKLELSSEQRSEALSAAVSAVSAARSSRATSGPKPRPKRSERLLPKIRKRLKSSRGRKPKEAKNTPRGRKSKRKG